VARVRTSDFRRRLSHVGGAGTPLSHGYRCSQGSQASFCDPKRQVRAAAAAFNLTELERLDLVPRSVRQSRHLHPAAASKVLHKLALMVVHDRCSVRSAGRRTSGSALSLVPLTPVMLIARRNRPSKKTSGVLSRHQVSVRREAVHI